MARVYPKIGEGSRKRYDSQLVHQILPALGHLQVRDIGYAEMVAFIGGMKDMRGNPASDRMKNECTMRVREILGLYVKIARGRLETPREDWGLAEPPKKPRKKKRDEPPEDVTARLLGACQGEWEWLKGPIFAGAYLGLRRGEIAGLTKGKIDRRNMRLEVSEQLTPETGATLMPVKGGEERARIIPLTKDLLDLFDQLMDPSSMFAFTMPRPGRGRRRPDRDVPRGPILPNELSKDFSALAKSLGFAITFHDLRSFAATNLAEIYRDAYAVAAILGHADIETSMIYVNPREAAMRRGLSRLHKLLSGKKTVDKRGVDTA